MLDDLVVGYIDVPTESDEPAEVDRHFRCLIQLNKLVIELWLKV